MLSLLAFDMCSSGSGENDTKCSALFHRHLENEKCQACSISMIGSIVSGIMPKIMGEYRVI